VTSPGKTILVVGAGRGIGAAVARALAERGHQVVAASRSVVDGATETLGDGRIESHALDVTDEPAVRRLFDRLRDRHGQLHAVLLSAGIGSFKPVVDTTLDEWNRTLATNLTGAFLVAKHAVPFLRASGGRIVHVGSVAGIRSIPGNGSYAVAKAGLRALSAMLNEDHPDGAMGSTYVALGATFTEIWRDRVGFRAEDMLPLAWVAEELARLLLVPARVRYEEVTLLPPKGVL
jgi:NAD(P)-dependent dehydrogenase (short-subunit alcohol dehydrogenase family)